MLLAIVIGLVSAVLFAVVESSPLVVVEPTEQLDQADSVNELLNQLKFVTRRRFFQQRIVIKEKQLNSLVGLLQRGLPSVAGKATTTIEQLNLQLSYQLPIDFADWYINFEASLTPGPGLKPGPVTIGAITISGERALSMLVWAANWKTDSQIGSLAIEQINGVHVFPDETVIVLKPIHNFLQALNQVRNGITGSGDEVVIARTRFYLETLTSLKIRQHQPGRSLSEFIQPLFVIASQNNHQSSPIIENQAALLALAIYVGHHRLANFVGDVQPDKNRAAMPRYRPLLAQRTDLTQHFVISAAIKILSQQGVSLAIGEFKELMDRAKGGSGFSFVDLAADMAGVELAVVASDENSALAIQQKLSEVNSEKDFFPSITGLQEGLNKVDFASQYDKVDSDKYLHKVQIISNRIKSLPIYSQ